MPMRTTSKFIFYFPNHIGLVNYQYRFGGGFQETVRKLYGEGGARRFYRGISPALLQGPLSR